MCLKEMLTYVVFLYSWLDVCISLVHNKISHKSRKSFSAELGCLSRVGLRNHALPFQPSNYTDRINLL